VCFTHKRELLFGQVVSRARVKEACVVTEERDTRLDSQQALKEQSLDVRMAETGGSDLGSDSDWVPANEAEHEEINEPQDRGAIISPVMLSSTNAPTNIGGGIFKSRLSSAQQTPLAGPLSSEPQEMSPLQSKDDGPGETRTDAVVANSLDRQKSLQPGGDAASEGSWGSGGGGSEDGIDQGEQKFAAENLLFSMGADLGKHAGSVTVESEDAIVQKTQMGDVGNRSVLDCVVELFRGAICRKQKSFNRTGERWIWLSHELNGLCWKSKRTGLGRLALSSVKKLKVMDKDLHIEALDGKKTCLSFLTSEEALVWLAGLACLVPKKANVVGSDQLLRLRSSYDPLKDSYSGRAVQYRKVLNEYLLLSTIWHGSFGKVKLAVSKKDKQFYALKIVHKTNRGGSLSGIRPDASQCAVLYRLKHPNIVRHRDVLFDSSNETQIHVVQYMPRGIVMDCTKLEGVKPMSEEGVRELMRDVVLGLEYLHENRIVHLDIKPSSMLRGGDGGVRLTDFDDVLIYGLGEETVRERMHLLTAGTPAFAAPELCVADNESDSISERNMYQADIWSLGASLFYMVFGSAPFQGETLSEISEAICSQKLAFPSTPKVSKKLKELLTKMLTRDARSRATLEEVKNHGWFIEKPTQSRSYPPVSYSDLDIENAVRAAEWKVPKHLAI